VARRAKRRVLPTIYQGNTFVFYTSVYKQVCAVGIKTKGVDCSTPSCFVGLCGEGGIGYCADKSAPLNAFPFCSPQGPLQRATLSKKLLRSPFVFYTSVYKQACAVGIKNKRRRLLDTFLLRWSLRRGRDSTDAVEEPIPNKKAQDEKSEQ